MKLFELFAELGLQTDGFERGAKSAIRQGSTFATAISGNFESVTARAVALGNAMYDVGKQMTKLSFDAVKTVITEFADTEQLVGGVETLFKDSADKLIEYADMAYMTTGLSANDYMQQAVSFSAVLLQGLGGDTAAAVEYADMAMRDMADNANKFGTDISMIQNAYQGFARDNYTMLDNLKLGYGGTAAEMARLINDSGVLGDSIEVTADTVKDVPFYMVIAALHEIQKNMDITGTTAEEAANTVSGSVSAFQAAWENFLAGMANDEKSMGPLVDALFVAGENVVSNVLALIPTIWDHTLDSISAVVDKWDVTSRMKDAYDEDGWRGVWDEATAVLEAEFNEWGPKAYDSGTEVLANILSGLTGDPVSAEQIRQELSGLWSSGETAVSNFVTAASNVFGDIYTGFTGQEATRENITNSLATLFDSGKSALDGFLLDAQGLLGGIYTALTGDSENLDNIGAILGGLFSSGIEAAASLREAAGGLLGSIYTLITGEEATAENIGDTIGGLFSLGIDNAAELMQTATTFFSDLSKALGDPDASIGEKIAGVFKAGSRAASDLLDQAATFMGDLYQKLTGDIEGAKKVEEFFEGVFSIPKAIVDPEFRKPTYTGTSAKNDVWEYDYRSMVQTMRASPREYGITESMADEWLAILMRYDSGEQYEQAIQEIVSAWESSESNKESEDENDEALSSAIQEMSLAAKDMSAAAKRMAAMQIVLDSGTLVGAVSAALTRGARAGLYTAGTAFG